MFIELYGRGDRLGANIICFIAQIFYAIHHNLFIKYDRAHIRSCDNVRFVPYDQKYNGSVFVESLFFFIDWHNEILQKQEQQEQQTWGECVEVATIHWFEMTSKVLQEIKTDYFSYFHEKIWPVIAEFFHASVIEKNYVSSSWPPPFDPQRSILVHLRLDDCRHRQDYNGFHCADHFRKAINSNQVATNDTHWEIAAAFPNNNTQSPLSPLKLHAILGPLKAKYPEREIILITNQGENTCAYPYRCIATTDENHDLYLLSTCDIVVLSRSTYSLCSLFFNNNQKEIFIPLWGHLPCIGLFTKFDKNVIFRYFE
jgi:hypothetical protein